MDKTDSFAGIVGMRFGEIHEEKFTYLLISNFQKKSNVMIIVPVKEGENIERALKKFKRKSEKTGIIKEQRIRREFQKPSVVKRKKMQHAIYVNKLHQEED